MKAPQLLFRRIAILVYGAGVVLAGGELVQGEPPANFVVGNLIALSDNGARSWFMDERAIVRNGKRLVGSVRPVKDIGRGTDDGATAEVDLHHSQLDRRQSAANCAEMG